ncbi:MAG: CvpA family protein [Christensenellaceae bacterium]
MFNLLAFQAAYALDIACALILIIWAFIGAKKGFVKCFFGLVSTLIALVLAITLASTVSGWLDSAFGMTGFFSGKFENTFLKINGFDADISSVGIASALENVNLPGFQRPHFEKSRRGNNLPPLPSQVRSLRRFSVCRLLISGLVIFIVARLLFLIVEKFFPRSCAPGPWPPL